MAAALSPLALSAGPRGWLPAALADTQSDLASLVNLRFGMFNHFNLGTFTDEEWAAPFQNPARFAPTAVDCGQWADAAAAAGMSYGVLTTKHHDGFALWPTAYGSQNVSHSSWNGDVVQAYCDAFRSRGLRVGLYFSIWDRTHTVEAYGGHVSDSAQEVEPENLALIEGQITELLSNYGAIDMFVTDGYAWQMGQRRVPYQRIRNLVKSLQPHCVMIDHGALSVPWLGDAIYFEEPLGVSAPANNTYAGVQGQTISNGWFWHPSTPSTDPMSKQSILDHLAYLEPLWTSFLLNCPPNRDGKLDTNIVTRLAEVGAAWSPNTSRPALPTQPLRAEWPVTPVAAYATGWHAGEGAMRAIDAYSDRGAEQCWSTWSTTNGTGALALPQSLVIDLGGVWSNVSTLEYLPKQWNRTGGSDGDITAATISVSTDGTTWTQVASPSWAADNKPKLAEWSNRNVGFVKMTVTAASGNYANVNDLRIGGRSVKPTLVSRTVSTGTTYRLVNRNSGLVLDVYYYGTANGTNIQQYTWTGAACQKFAFVDAGDGFMKLKDQNSGKLVEVAGLSRATGGNVGLWADASCYQQHWAITPVGGGYVIMTNRFSGLVMAGTSSSTAAGANVEQAEYDGSTRCQWQLVAV
ncbi:alpha-L-fucosidase [Nocardioides acrostichi]|uniref:alpha-L-fucosidase n=1 Tax=Nocardioides acrostichi TaxID=2784339 RepID=UPI001A9CB6F5|nr:alpha-L-fucosidase [Nocardioides acrostichi]